jgi:PIN domain nuclease of toxin-antitoxin system
MNAYKIRSIVMADGSIVLKGLPFSVGKSVEVIVLDDVSSQELASPKLDERWKSLQGIEDWLEIALSHPKISSIDLTIPIIIKSTQLPGFHKYPADQIIVATSMILGIPLLTADEKIIAYPDVTTLD